MNWVGNFKEVVNFLFINKIDILLVDQKMVWI
jgi:hypothetical protein